MSKVDELANAARAAKARHDYAVTLVEAQRVALVKAISDEQSAGAEYDAACRLLCQTAVG